MGSPMALHLLSFGYSLSIYARDPSRALQLQFKGARLINSPQDLAKISDIVFTIIGGPPDVRSIILSPQGVLAGLNPGSVIVDTTSSHLAIAREIFKSACEKDCWSVDAPVSSADVGAREGRLAILAGGDSGVTEYLVKDLGMGLDCLEESEEGCHCPKLHCASNYFVV
ncbi:hypothetical protein Pint_22604 [Pistacia integerrima]|uniref:Uncharacterized protein n=1 Tax=Pistacia integerrima TaxID=434235 RepID=A0ACC0YME0_9ROSI|nr:hypothetical protein Pint_22604 [Pistacia integerrima]